MPDREGSAPLDWRIKGLPPAAEGLRPDQIGRLGLNLLESDLMMPVAVLRESALSHNIAAMQAFADRVKAHLCPHGKTSMSPELFALQLAAGAWGLTAATAHHVRVYRRLRIGRIFLANQLIARADIALVLDELAADPDFDFYCLADSVEGVDLLASAAANRGLKRPVQLLVETGYARGRAGSRSVEEALEVARRIAAAAPVLALRGIETFEGITQTAPDARRDATSMLNLAGKTLEAAVGEKLLAEGLILISAGGSAFLDLCDAQLPKAIRGRPVERILRPGCYVTHDHGLYDRLTRARDGTSPALEPALEVCGVVQSLPEAGLAIVGLGKRDVSHDVDPPRPLWRYRPRRDERPMIADNLSVLSLWDQHLSLACPPGALRIGDLIGFGISHPCATFDRWRALFIVDERYRVTGVATTLF